MPLTLADLSPAAIEKIKARRYDRIIEKHEGPFRWEDVFRWETPEFFEIDGRAVLLPVGVEHHPKITVLRCIPSADGEALTVFLKDTTFSSHPEHEWIDAGFLAVCERMKGEEFFIASVYHEWFILDERP